MLAATTALAACCAAPEKEADTTTESGVDAATATSAADFGGMDELVKAAQEEGELNVIALPPDWANYGEIIKAFEDKYDIKINSDQPDAASQDEINAANQLKGTRQRARRLRPRPVRGAGQHRHVRALPGRDLRRHPRRASRTPDGAWVNDYGGYMSIGYDSAKVPDVTSLADLLEARVQGQGRAQRRPDPGRRGVQRRDDGLDRQRRLRRRHRARRRLLQASSRRPATSCRSTPTPTTIESGPDPGRHRLGLPERRRRPPSVPTWKTVVPDNAVVAGYYFQAINNDAPHPAAARLWQEFLYSDEGQNLWLKGGARPVRADAMAEAGTIDAGRRTPRSRGHRHAGDPDRRADREEPAYLAANWAKAVG